MITYDYDIIVVGAGHAGVEASLAGARMGYQTLLATTNLDRIGFMSCNPSIGGLAKGHMVRELDALGGEMATNTDKTCIQFKRLNSKKGPAVRGSRAQCDKDLYCLSIADVLKNSPNLSILKSEVKSLVLENHEAQGVVLEDGSKVFAKKVILTTGTFMRGVMHIGLQRIEGGRVGDASTVGLSDQLDEYGFEVKRLKTGTPPRLEKDSINWEKTEGQSGDDRFIPFSFMSDRILKLPQIQCFLTYTNEKTHEIIRKNLDKSPMYTGVIEGTGPRYCPSIEDKITRFADKTRHQSFLEIEGLNTQSVYLQGISTSLPEEVQQEFLQTIPGLEAVKMIRPGYAVEYDFIEPRQIYHSLETRKIKNLYLAGQINGTSGYEEAAVQGFIAGVNAALSLGGKEPFILGRDEAYIGVLIDDLVTKGTREPYRMFTSRAEHRLVLREDNCLERLLSKGVELGLVKGKKKAEGEKILSARKELLSQLHAKKLVPNEETQKKIRSLNTKILLKPATAAELLKRHEVSIQDLKTFDLPIPDREELTEPVEIAIKYAGYITRQNEIIQRIKNLENMLIPEGLEFKAIRGLSSEEIEKLSQIKPRTVGQAQRISGVNPSAIQALIMYLKAGSIKPNRTNGLNHP